MIFLHPTVATACYSKQSEPINVYNRVKIISMKWLTTSLNGKGSSWLRSTTHSLKLCISTDVAKFSFDGHYPCINFGLGFSSSQHWLLRHPQPSKIQTYFTFFYSKVILASLSTNQSPHPKYKISSLQIVVEAQASFSQFWCCSYVVVAVPRSICLLLLNIVHLFVTDFICLITTIRL